jgi:hypothetical protein
MHGMCGAYPGLERRLEELAGLVDVMASEAAAQSPSSGLDIAALPEMAVVGGLSGSGAEVAFPLEGPVFEVKGAAVRRNRCYVVVPLQLIGRLLSLSSLLVRLSASYDDTIALLAVPNPCR